MSTNKSQNLNLHLWVPEDNFLRSEFNENFAALDSAVKADRASIQSEAAARQKALNDEKTAREAADTAEAQAREEVRTLANAASLAATRAQQTADAAWSAQNPGWVVGSYKGTGTVPATLKLGFRPSAFYILGAHTPIFIYPASIETGYEITWLDDGLSWSNPDSSNASNSFNHAKQTYFYIAFR